MSLSPLTSESVPMAWVESLFSKLSALYGNKFLDMWRGTDMASVKALWGAEMSKLTRDELKRGVDSLVSREWPPTLPEFIKLCRPPMDALAAYQEAVNGVYARERGEIGQWSHPAIYWASVAVGAFDLKSMSYTQIKGRWENALQAEMDKGVWVDIPKPMIALPAPDKREIDRVVADKVLDGLKDMSGSSKTDHRLWAKRLLKRVADGEKIPVISVQMARDALSQKESA